MNKKVGTEIISRYKIVFGKTKKFELVKMVINYDQN